MKKVLFIFLLFIFLIMLPGTVLAQGKVVVVSLGRIHLQQLMADEYMSMWLNRGAVGLMNTGTAAGPYGRHLYITMGAGSRALGADSGRLAFMQEEEYNGSLALEIYRRHLGQIPKGQIVHVGMAEIVRVNQSLQHPIRPGLLGDSLHDAGKVTALIGNADGNQVNREASLFIADSRGQVDLGNVSRELFLLDECFPYGRRLDKERIWQAFLDVYPRADVIVIDWGDTVRLDEYRSFLTNEAAEEIVKEIFKDVSWVMTNVFARLDADDLFVLLATVPQGGLSGADTLGFMEVMGTSFIPGQLLTSATTRRPGLVAVTDVAPLILEHLGLPTPADMVGRSVSTAGAGSAEDLEVMRESISYTYQLRPPLLKTYVIFQIIFVLGALFNLFIRIIDVRRFEGLLLSLLTVPLLLLYLPLDSVSMPAAFALTVLTVIASVLALQRLLREPVQRFAVVAVLTSVSLVVDILRSAPLVKVSVLGYDPVSGARYYGLGNEYMGVLVGSAILAAAAVITLWPRHRRITFAVTAVFFIVILLLMVSPGGGANFGGSLTALAAFIVTSAVLLQLRLSWKSGLIILTGLAAVALAAILINYLVPQNAQSHLGRTLVLLQNQGWQALWDIIVRKGTMNLKLLRYSQWTRVFLAFLSMMAVLFYRPRGVLRDVHKQYPFLAAGFLGIIAGSITALLVNDSGVVAAATTLLYAGVPIIILVSRVVEEIENSAVIDK